MRFAVFALFDDHGRADAALEDIRTEDLGSDEDINVLVHEEGFDPGRPELQGESDGGPGVRRGLLLGALVGAAAGAIVGGPVGLIAAGPLAGAVLGGGTGGLMGALSGGLYGAGTPDPKLERLAEHLRRGKVLVTFQTQHRGVADRVEAIARRHGAEVEHKRV